MIKKEYHNRRLGLRLFLILSQCSEEDEDDCHQHKKYYPLKGRYRISAWNSKNELNKILNNIH